MVIGWLVRKIGLCCICCLCWLMRCSLCRCWLCIMWIILLLWNDFGEIDMVKDNVNLMFELMLEF